MPVGEKLAVGASDPLPEVTLGDAALIAIALGAEEVTPLVDEDPEDLFAQTAADIEALFAEEKYPELAEAYHDYYHRLYRLAHTVVRNTVLAEDAVQLSFAKLLKIIADGGEYEPGKLLAYLRQAVVNNARTELRHMVVIDKHDPLLLVPERSYDSTAEDTMIGFDRAEVIAALRALPNRQREAIVYRYYGGMKEAEVAAAMGISRGAVKSHTARGMAALKPALAHLVSNVD